MESEFFITVANYPIEKNIDKYSTSLNNVESKLKISVEYNYGLFLVSSIESLQKKSSVIFGKQDIYDFEGQRKILLDALEHVVGDQGLEESGSIIKCITRANTILMSRTFLLGSKKGGEVKIDMAQMGMRSKTGTPEAMLIEDIFDFACYSLISFLYLNKRRSIKKCPICQNFFIAGDTKRKNCYSSSCRKEHRRLYKQHQREVDPVKYM